MVPPPLPRSESTTTTTTTMWHDAPQQQQPSSPAEPVHQLLPSRTWATTSSSKSSSSTASASAADMTRRMVCGGLAGCIAKTATNPLERIKMLSQTGEHGLTNGSVVSLYRSILQREGVIGLWAGNGTNLLRIFPAKAVVFATNDMYLSMFKTLTMGTTPHGDGDGSGKDRHRVHPTYSFLAGGLAGMTATACTYPLDFARGRIAGKLAPMGQQKEYRGIVSTVILTVRDEGLLALYKGVTPTLLGALPYEGIKFGTVGLLERAFPVSSSSSDGPPASPIRKMVYGGLGGVAAGLITYPNDTVRRLLQLQGSRGTNSRYLGYWDCVRQTYQQEGITRFYRGVTINLIRMAPNAAVQFGSYELLKQLTAGYL